MVNREVVISNLYPQCVLYNPSEMYIGIILQNSSISLAS